jgi:hypothetical protein
MSSVDLALRHWMRTWNSNLLVSQRRLISSAISLPPIYPYRVSVTDGGLVSYGSDPLESYRRATGYVDRKQQRIFM